MLLELSTQREMQCVLFSTMPRSGTWYNYFLWEHLDMLLSGRQDRRPHEHVMLFPSFGVARGHKHCACPNFTDLADHQSVARYQSLDFHTPGYDPPIDLGLQYSFKGSPDLRIVYVYRNPLDQIVSFFDHSIDHRDQSHMVPPPKHDSTRRYESASDLALRGAAESYLKQYLSFRYFADQSSPQVYMVPYEVLKRDPVTTFDRVLDFCRAELHPNLRACAVQAAVEMSEAKNIADLEQKKGGAIADDQTGDRPTHLRGGEIGKWKARLSDEAVNHVWTQFAEYGVYPSDFEIE